MMETKLGKNIQWIWLALGVAIAGAAALLKFVEVSNSQSVFEFVFFRGADYIIMIAGMVMVVMALGYDLFFKEG